MTFKKHLFGLEGTLTVNTSPILSGPESSGNK